MRSRKLAAALVPLGVAGAILVACSSTTTPAGTAENPSTTDAAACTGACCTLPSPSTACGDPTASCSTATTCSEGLVVTRTLACQGGSWQVTEDCPPAGGVDATGCPSAQPTKGAPCQPADGGLNPTCDYAKACGTQSCNDAGVCSQVFSRAQATCVSGMWQTTPLGC